LGNEYEISIGITRADWLNQVPNNYRILELDTV